MSHKISHETMFPPQRHPLTWSSVDKLYARSRQEAIYLLQTKWFACIDMNGNPTYNVREMKQEMFLIPMSVPAYGNFGVPILFNFFRLSVARDYNLEGLNYYSSQVKIIYVNSPLPKLVPYERYEISKMNKSLHQRARLVQNTNEKLIESRL